MRATSDSPRRRLPPIAILAALALCLLHSWLAVAGSDRVGPAYDEAIHLASGRAYWQAGDFRFQPENGNLPQRWLALPLLGDQWRFPSPAEEPDAWRDGDPWPLSRAWLFGRGVDLADILFRARCMNALLGAALCAVVFLWSASLFGLAGGFLSLGLAVFCPNLLAHAGLATSDTCAALLFAVASLAWWRLLHRLTPSRLLAAGLATGALALAKYSAVLLGPVVLALLLARVARRAPLPWKFATRGGRLRGPAKSACLGGATLAALALALTVVWAAYDFRSDASPRGPISEANWDLVLLRSHPATTPPAGAMRSAIGLVRDSRLLPEAWVYGFAYVARHSMTRASYLEGEYSDTGSPAFFPVAFLVKTPPAGLAALAAALAWLMARRPRRLLYRLLPAGLLLVVYWTAAVGSHLNIGYRHLLPTLPLCWLVAGACARALPASVGALGPAALALLLGGVQAASAWSVAPHFLTYFNSPSGGPAAGPRHLVDSSLDWGQGLPELDRWLRAQNPDGEAPAAPIHLSYFGTDDPARFPWKFIRVADALFDKRPRDLPAPMRGGLYCIGATMWVRVYTPVSGPWTAARERRYRELSAWFAQDDLSRAPGAAAPLSPEAVKSRLNDLEQLRFARLCFYLADRAPDALVANCMLVFRLNDAEVFAALNPDRPATRIGAPSATATSTPPATPPAPR